MNVVTFFYGIIGGIHFGLILSWFLKAYREKRCLLLPTLTVPVIAGILWLPLWLIVILMVILGYFLVDMFKEEVA